MALFKLQALLFLMTDQRQHIFFILIAFINDKPISHHLNLILAVIKFLTVFIVFAKKKSRVRNTDCLVIVWLLGYCSVAGGLPEHDRHTASFSVRSHRSQCWADSAVTTVGHQQARQGRGGQGWRWMWNIFPATPGDTGHPLTPGSRGVAVTLAPVKLESKRQLNFLSLNIAVSVLTNDANLNPQLSGSVLQYSLSVSSLR